MELHISQYLFLGITLFTIGLGGLLLRRNLIVMFMSIELMLNAINLLFIAFAKFNHVLDGQVVVFFVMLIAACEAAVGLALIINVFKHFKSIKTDDFNLEIEVSK